MKSFQFFPELLVQRGEAQRFLNESGFEWLTDYKAIDVDHELYGLEVEGIQEERTARAILCVLRRNFPNWHWHGVVLKDRGIEPGWIARITQHSDRERENDDK